MANPERDRVFCEIVAGIHRLARKNAASTSDQFPRTLTILTGAGASAFARGPSSDEITTILNQNALSQEIYQAILNAAPGSSLNFEDILHILEELELLALPPLQGHEYEPPLRIARDARPFLKPTEILGAKGADWRWLRKTRFALLETIRHRCQNIFIQYRQWKTLYDWLSPLAEAFNFNWYTLNYDLLADIVCYALACVRGAPWTDGFGTADERTGYRSLDPALFIRFLQRSGNILAHIHGSVGFLYTHTSASRGQPGYQLLRCSFPVVDLADSNWLNPWEEAGMRPEFLDLGISPIISGLRKPDKMNSQPYSLYFHGLAQSLFTNPDLLLIGYGGNDAHINSCLSNYFAIHGDRARVVEVTTNHDPKRSVISRFAPFTTDLWTQSGEDVYRRGKAAVMSSGFRQQGADVRDVLETLNASRVHHAKSEDTRLTVRAGLMNGATWKRARFPDDLPCSNRARSLAQRLQRKAASHQARWLDAGRVHHANFEHTRLTVRAGLMNGATSLEAVLEAKLRAALPASRVCSPRCPHRK